MYKDVALDNFTIMMMFGGGFVEASLLCRSRWLLAHIYKGRLKTIN